jgi:flagellar hook-associated protein 3 FlgL
MRVTFSSGFAGALHAINDTAGDLVEAQRQVSSGRRLQGPSDDPSAASAAVVEYSELAVTDQYRQATDTVSARLSVIDTVLQSIVDQITAAKTAVQSGRGTVPEAQREAAADSLLAARDSLLAAVNTQYRGVFLFSGAAATTQPYSKTGDTVSAYQGASTVVQVDIDRQTAVDAVVDAGSLFQGSDPEDLFAVLDDLAAALRSGDSTAVASGSAALDRAFDRVNRGLGKIGADMALVAAQQGQLDARTLASKARLSALEDVNLAQAITEMNRAETAYQAALGAVSRTTRLSLLDYLP